MMNKKMRNHYGAAFKKVLAFMLCLSFVAASAFTDPVSVQADAWLDYINKCLDSMVSFTKADTGLSMKDQVAWAYLVGTDDIADKSWLVGYHTHDLYAVEPGTKINGKDINPKYLPQDNKEYLISIKEHYMQGDPEKSDLIYRKPDNFQGTHREGAKFRVFACDEEWVTIWDDGFQIWEDQSGIINCMQGQDAYLETHPAGFYKIKRDVVWLDFGLPANHPYQSEEEIPKKGNGTVTKLVNLRPVPNEKETVYTPVYVLPMGTKLNVVSTELVPSEAPGSKHKYYKVSFNGSDKVQNNTVYYMAYKVPGMYYIDSRYLNFSKKGEKTPEGAAPGKITNVKNNDSVYAYQSKDANAEQIGILSKNVEIQMFPSESDAEWTAVYFSGQKCYVQTKYIKRAPYKVKDITRPYIADVVNNELVIAWNKGEGNVDFSCKITAVKNKKLLWSEEHLKENQVVVKDSDMQEAQGRVKITVQANNVNGGKGKEYTYSFLSNSITPLQTKNIWTQRTSISTPYKSYKNKRRYISSLGRSLQISTDKDFKNAWILEKSYNEKGETKYENIQVIEDLKPNTTYYIRRRAVKKVKTAAGEKQMKGHWSKAVKVKTKK